MLQDFAGLLFTTGEGIGCCRGWLGTVDPGSHVMTHKNCQTKPTAVGRLLTADALVRSWIEIIKNPTLLLLLRLSSLSNSFWPLQPEREKAEWAEKDKPLPQECLATRELRRQIGLVLLKSSSKKPTVPCWVEPRSELTQWGWDLSHRGNQRVEISLTWGTKTDKSRTLHGKYEI